MDIPNSDIVIPVAIIVVCLLVVLITYRLTSQRAKDWQLVDLDDTGGLEETLIDIDALDGWHRDHGRVVTTWIESHEETLDRLGKSGLQLDLTSESPVVDQAADTAIRDAITAHPNPAMRAQLSAMTVAAEATVVAVRRSDYETAERQHLTYIEYRDQWLPRLRQFSPDDSELGAVSAEADRHGADWALRPVPDTSADTTPGAAEPERGSLVAELGTDQDAETEDPWQITRPRRSRRRRRHAG